MKCGCCEREVEMRDWSFLYSCCDKCAFCQSLGMCGDGEEAECCHGKCLEKKS